MTRVLEHFLSLLYFSINTCYFFCIFNAWLQLFSRILLDKNLARIFTTFSRNKGWMREAKRRNFTPIIIYLRQQLNYFLGSCKEKESFLLEAGICIKLPFSWLMMVMKVWRKNIHSEMAFTCPEPRKSPSFFARKWTLFFKSSLSLWWLKLLCLKLDAALAKEMV